MKKFFLAASMSIIAGCATGTGSVSMFNSVSLVKAPGVSDVPDEYAPINKKEENFGVVGYLNDGADFVIKGRIDKAYKLMHETCNGKYYLLDEANLSSSLRATTTVSPTGNKLHTSTYRSNFKHLYFACAEQP